jgi:superfamily I DNA/RNA helicase
VIVPSTLTVRTRTKRYLQAGLTDFLLDYNQEAAFKTDLDLPLDDSSLARDFRLNIVNGVAGSGKTLILLYRLRMLQALYPEKQFLVLTHNRPLIRDMQSRYHRLTGGLPDAITWGTFMSWCHSQWPSEPAWTVPIGEGKRAQFLRRTWSEFFHGTSITQSMLRSEIDWFKDQSCAPANDYLHLERRGRGFRLMPEQRQRMAQAIDHYQNLLEQNDRMDWGNVPRRLWGFLQDGRLHLPDYDAVLVDEAQFFAPLWFDIIRELVRPRSGHLFVVADPTQGFLGRGASWKSLGLEARGRTHKLEHSYRTTREILNFATLFFRRRVAENGTEDDILALDLNDLSGGAFPQMIPLGSPQDEITCISNEVAEFARQGLPPGHLLVLHANWQGVQALIAAINRKLEAKKAFDPKDQYPGDYVRVTTFTRKPLINVMALIRKIGASTTPQGRRCQSQTPVRMEMGAMRAISSTMKGVPLSWIPPGIRDR